MQNDRMCEWTLRAGLPAARDPFLASRTIAGEELIVSHRFSIDYGLCGLWPSHTHHFSHIDDSNSNDVIRSGHKLVLDRSSWRQKKIRSKYLYVMRIKTLNALHFFFSMLCCTACKSKEGIFQRFAVGKKRKKKWTKEVYGMIYLSQVVCNIFFFVRRYPSVSLAASVVSCFESFIYVRPRLFLQWSTLNELAVHFQTLKNYILIRSNLYA